MGLKGTGCGTIPCKSEPSQGKGTGLGWSTGPGGSPDEEDLKR